MASKTSVYMDSDIALMAGELRNYYKHTLNGVICMLVKQRYDELLQLGLVSEIAGSVEELELDGD